MPVRARLKLSTILENRNDVKPSGNIQIIIRLMVPYISKCIVRYRKHIWQQKSADTDALKSTPGLSCNTLLQMHTNTWDQSNAFGTDLLS